MSPRRRWVSDLEVVIQQPMLALWCILVLSIPFYILPSGLPQPGNFLIFLLLPLMLYAWNGRLPKERARPLRWLWWFTVWQTVVNLAWAVILGVWSVSGDSFTIFPFYYTYNLLVFFAVLVLHQRYQMRFVRVTIGVVLFAVGIQVAASFVMRDASQLRGELFFNNPNQLGFYALLAASIIALAQRPLQLGMLTTTLALLGCTYLAFISASRAAVGGIAIMFFLLVFSNPRVIIVGALVVLALVFAGGPVAKMLDATEKRVEYRRDETIVEGRGYDRIWKYRELAVIGAGEGGKARFAADPKHAFEIHSSFGTALFSYGLPGLIMLVGFLWQTARGAPFRTMLLLVPAFAYMMTHQGLRFSMLWVLFGLFVVLKGAIAAPPAAVQTR